MSEANMTTQCNTLWESIVIEKPDGGESTPFSGQKNGLEIRNSRACGCQKMKEAKVMRFGHRANPDSSGSLCRKIAGLMTIQAGIGIGSRTIKLVLLEDEARDPESA
jgi:hypothetical protein